MSPKLRLLVASIPPLIILFVPSSWIPVAGLTTIEQRLLAILVMATLFWILEPVPIFATSVLIIVLELLMVSDKSFVLFQGTEGDARFGTVLSYKEIMATFASPIIMLFLGGFFLAMAAAKYRLDVNLARVLLKPFGTNPRTVLLGLMVITAVFSMFMSNTATTAMMLAILTPVLVVFQKEDPGRIAFVLGVPFAANIGGLGTPIGTPPNAVALKYLTGAETIGFGTWMSFGVPLVLVLLLFTWRLLLWMFPPAQDEMTLNINGKFLKTHRAIVVYVTFVVTILLWLADFLHGMNAYIVALIPVAVFSAGGIISTEDLRRISWDVLWLVSGGIALGIGLEQSGAAGHLVAAIPFANLPAYVIVLLVTLVTLIMASFMSNTATANLLLPIVAALAVTLPGLSVLGGRRMLVLAVAMASSLAMTLPISTPPNALAHATGLVETRHIFRAGLFIGLVGLMCSYALLAIMKLVGFF